MCVEAVGGGGGGGGITRQKEKKLDRIHTDTSLLQQELVFLRGLRLNELQSSKTHGIP